MGLFDEAMGNDTFGDMMQNAGFTPHGGGKTYEAGEATSDGRGNGPAISFDDMFRNKQLETRGDVLGGRGENAGILGIGQYKAPGFDINYKYFNDPTKFKKNKKELSKAITKVENRDTPQMKAAKLGQAATINQKQQDQFRRGQLDLAYQLQQQAAGKGPSLAQSQLRQGTDRNLAQAMAMAGSGRGNSALQMRQLGQQRAMIGQQAGQQAADLRMQEQMAAQQQLAGVLSGGRGQDIGLATDQANLKQQRMLNQGQLQQQAAANNQAAVLQNRGLSDAQVRYLMGEKLGQDQQLAQNRIMGQQLGVQQQTSQNTVNQAAYESASKRKGDFTGKVGGAIAAMSDEKLKTDISSGDEKTESFLSKFGEGLKAMNESSKKKDDSSTEKTGGDGIASIIGMMGSSEGGGYMESMSDKENKKGVKNGERSVQGFLDAINAHSYKYKDAKFGEGTHVSPMAQELEKTKVGKSAVIDTPEGKMVDYGKLGGVMLASQAMLNDRLAELEKIFKSRRGKVA